MVGMAPLLRIEQTYGRIGIETQPAQLSIQQPKADMQLKQVPAKLEVEREPLQLHIDQSECWAERGLKSFVQLNWDMAQESREKVLEAIGNYAEIGDRLMRIENGGNPLLEIAQEIGNPPPVDFNIDVIPKSRPKINFTGGEVHFRVQEGGVDLQVTPNKAIVEATPPEVNISMQQWQELKIDYIGKPLLIGDNLDIRW